MKKIYLGNEALDKLVEGSTLLARAVGTTLGPRGRNAAIDRGFDVIVVHDGVTVAREVEAEDPAVNDGVRIIRQAANKQVDAVGDGTTVTTILANAILTECQRIIATGVNPMELREGLEQGVNRLVTELDIVATPIETVEEKIQVATISAEDPELGKMIGETIDSIGVDGIITIEESKTAETFVEHQEGMQYEGGYISPYFVTNPARLEATVEDALILITDKNVVNIQELTGLLDKVTKITRNFVVIAPDVTDSALASFVLTKVQGGMNIMAVKAPSFGDTQREMLIDIATLTGGTVITGEAGQRFEGVELAQLGRAQRVTATKDATLIVGGQGDKGAITQRIEAIKEQLSRADGSDFQIEKLRERIGKLGSGVAIIKVGGHTEVEMRERKERAIDAVAATQAAIKEGIVPGGEVVYLTIRGKLPKTPTGKILYRALEKPFAKLVENAGQNAGTLLAKLEDKEVGWGFDVTDGVFKNMIDAGIIDPVQVSKSALLNAVSVAILAMTTDVLIVPVPERKEGDNGQKPTN